ncbi:outer membrane beta-barrel protein [Tenacibaculum sp. 190524A05c]
MKNLFSVAFLFAIFFSVKSYSQSGDYGVTAGYNNFILSASVDQIPGSGSDGSSGYYVGVYGDFDLGDKFSIQPELQFGQVFNNGETGEMLLLPVMFKYYLVDRFNIQAGPVLDLILGNEEEEINDFGLGFGFGGAFDINEELSLTTRYSVGITNRTPDLTASTVLGGTFDINSRFDFFQVGLSYKF